MTRRDEWEELDPPEFDAIRWAFHAVAMNDPVYRAAMQATPTYEDHLRARPAEDRERDEERARRHRREHYEQNPATRLVTSNPDRSAK